MKTLIFKTMKRLAFLVLCTLLYSSAAIAAPSVVSVSGTMSHGQSVIITGTGFGTKSPAAPILWETFDDGIDGQSVSTKQGWYSYAGPGAVFNSTQPYSGTLSAYNYTEYGDNEGFATSYYVLPTQTKGRLYVSCMFRHSGSLPYDHTRVPKNWRINTPGNHYNGPGLMALSDGHIFYRTRSDFFYPEDDNGTGRWFSEPEYGSSTWTRHEGYLRYSNPAGTANGYMWAAVGTQQKTFANILNRLEGDDYQPGEYLLGLMHDHGSHQLGDYHHMWVDDVYIDNTLARVEVGNASAWASCTHKDVQIPTAWSSGEITVTVNRGAFAADDTAYIYVIDEDGGVNSTGYEIIFGGGEDPDTTPPSVTITTSPQTVSTSSVSISFTVSDNIGVTSRKWRIGSAPDATHGTDCISPATVTGLSVGQNTVYIGAGDAAGNWGSDSVVITYQPVASAAGLRGVGLDGVRIR